MHRWIVFIFALAACFTPWIDLPRALRTTLPGLASFTPMVTHAATLGLTLALFFIGTGLTRQTLAAIGGRALTHALLLWILIGGGSLLWVRFAAGSG